MKIGLLSDSHDNLPKIEQAVRFFNKNKIDFVLHAGDFIAPFAIPKLKSLASDWRGIFGNNDGEKVGLSRISEGKIQEGPLRIKLGNKKLTLVHELTTIDTDKEDADCIISGHTHQPEIIRQKDKLLINPGESSGWLTGKSTVALLDLDSLTAEIFRI